MSASRAAAPPLGVLLLLALAAAALGGCAAPEAGEELPTAHEAIKAMEEAHRHYDDSFGLVSDEEAERRWIQGMVDIVESFPPDWRAGLMVVRYRGGSGEPGCGYYPVVATEAGYLFGRYYLKGVEIPEVSYEEVYGNERAPLCQACKEPVAIWRDTDLWQEQQEDIWEDDFWAERGASEDPVLEEATWLPLR